MGQLYEILAKGETIGRAFQSAREKTRDRMERMDQWGPFILFGNPNMRLLMKEDDV